MRRLVVMVAWSSLLAVACACKSRGAGGAGGGTGTGTGTGAPGDCDGARANVEALYRADATAAHANEPDAAKAAQLIDEQTADNVAMVMTDCAADPARVAGCARAARSVAELESSCLIPLDDTGSEGERLK